MNITTRTKRLFLLLSGAALLIGFFWYQQAYSEPPEQLRVNAFKVTGGWGFEILANDKTFIYQPFIPGMPGKKAFPGKKAALKAGNDMKDKLLKGNMLPPLRQNDAVNPGAGSPENSQ